jgi:hypothetical protein
MAQCAYCKTETELQENGTPICPTCSNMPTKRKPAATDQQLRSILLQDILELTARTNEAAKEFEAVMGRIPSGLPRTDGTQRIKNASSKLTIARKELMKAHTRLNDYIEHGICSADNESGFRPIGRQIRHS